MKKFNFIYKITNLINNKIYVGKHSTDKLEDGYFGSGKILKKAIKKYSKENFKREIIEYCDIKDIDEREIHWIKKLKTIVKGYNLTDGGEGTLGLVHSKESIERMIKSREGFTHSKESKEKMSETRKERGTFAGKNNPMFEKFGELNPMFGKKGKNHPSFGYIHTEEARKKMSKANKGKTLSKEQKKILSEFAKTRTGEKNPFHGKTHSEESKEKNRQAQLNQPIKICPHCSLESRSAANMKRYHFDNCKHKNDKRAA